MLFFRSVAFRSILIVFNILNHFILCSHVIIFPSGSVLFLEFLQMLILLMNTLDFGIHAIGQKSFRKDVLPGCFEEGHELNVYLGFSLRFSILCMLYRKNHSIHTWAIKLMHLFFLKHFLISRKRFACRLGMN